MSILSFLKQWFHNLRFGNFRISSDGSIHEGEKPTPFPDGMSTFTDNINQVTTDFSNGSNVSLFGALTNWLNAMSGEHMVNAEVERNAMQMQNQEDIYQRQVAGMQKAGLNPALLYQSGVGSGPSVSGSAPGANMSDLVQLYMLGPQKKLIGAQTQKAKDEGQAALISARAAERNAGANERNAGTNERNAGINEANSNTARMNAVTERMKVDIQRMIADSQIKVNENDAARLAAQAAFIQIQADQLPEQLEIARRNMKANERQAAAALQNAAAAARNAATNEKLSEAEIALRNAEAALTWANTAGRDVINKYLDARQQQELENLRKEGIKLDAQGRLVDKQGRLVDSQMVKTYVNCATDISGAINQWLNPFSKGPGSNSAPGFDLSGAYQGVAYGYD